MKKLSLFSLIALAAIPSQAALVTQYSFSEGAGITTSNDANPGTFDGTLLNGADFDSQNLPSGSGSSLVLSGGLDGVSLGGGSYLNNVSGATMSAWIQPEEFGTQNIFWVGRGGAGATGQTVRLALQTRGDGAFGLGGRRLDTQGFQSVVTADGLMTVGEVYHVAATIDYLTGDVLLYLNGSEVTSGNLSGSWGTGNTSDTDSAFAYLGRHGNGEDYVGLLDDVRLYDSVLSGAVIADLAVVPEPSSALLALSAFAFCARRRRS